jgi:hypothetical protein
MSVADLEGAGGPAPPPFSPEIYHQMLGKLKIWDPKYVIFFLFWGPPPFLERAPPFRNFWNRHCMYTHLELASKNRSPFLLVCQTSFDLMTGDINYRENDTIDLIYKWPTFTGPNIVSRFILIFRPFMACWLWRRVTVYLDQDTGLSASVAGQQGLLTIPRHLIEPPKYLEFYVYPFVSLTCNSNPCFRNHERFQSLNGILYIKAKIYD